MFRLARLRWHSIDAGSLREWAYRRSSGELYIRFSDGTLYRYQGVPRRSVREFRELKSDHERFFLRHWGLGTNPYDVIQ